MDPAPRTQQEVSTGRTLAGYIATAVGAALGGGLGGWGGLQAGAWYGDRFLPSELQGGPVLLGLVVGASAGAALVIWLFLRVSGLFPAGPTAVLFGAFAPTILAAPLLWGPGIELSQLLTTVIGATLLGIVLSRTAAIWTTGWIEAAGRTGIVVAASVWALEVLFVAVWLLGS